MMADVLTGRVDFAVATLSTSRAFLVEEAARAGARQRSALVGASRRAGPGGDRLRQGKSSELVRRGGVGRNAARDRAEAARRIRQGLARSELQKRLAENGTLIATSTSDEMRTLMVEEVATMEGLVKTLGLRQQ